MPLPRSALVCLNTTPYYHCIGRCVRRAFLCGNDIVTGKSFEHRRDWIVERLALLAKAFALDVCAYAIMNNHYHLVLKVNIQCAAAWSDHEVLDHWCQIFDGPLLVQRYRTGESLGAAELARVTEFIDTYRTRLADLSWFMRCLNEPIARMANAEDNCTGRFWEGRFKSQALLDEKALLCCMAYVDLNPIRASISNTPEESDYTSIQQRIVESNALAKTTQSIENLKATIPELLSLTGRLDSPQHLPFFHSDYLELVDWSGRAIHPGKRGKINDNVPSILARLSIEPNQLLRYLNRKERGFVNVVGSTRSIQKAALNLGLKFLKGISAAKRLFPQSH